MTVAPAAATLSLALFIGMLICLEVGYRIGHAAAAGGRQAHEGVGPIEAAIFALLGLLLGFAFAGAMSRLDARRQLIVSEANAIGTAYLRLDLLPSDQPELRRLFREYLEARLRAYDDLADVGAADRFMAESARPQQQIWTRAVAISQTDQTQNTARVVLPAINQMIDVTTARAVALRTRLPGPILVLLVVVALLSAVTAGYAMAKRTHRSPLHLALYATSVAVTVYIVLDLDNPRIGLIRLDATEQILRQLQDSIHP